MKLISKDWARSRLQQLSQLWGERAETAFAEEFSDHTSRRRKEKLANGNYVSRLGERKRRQIRYSCCRRS